MNFEKPPQEKVYSQEQTKILDHLIKVGADKPVGYLPIETISQTCDTDPMELKEKLEQKGLKTLLLNQEESNVHRGALFVYDENALNHLLNAHREILIKEGWPTDAESFIRNLKNTAAKKTELFDLIADSFGDKSNPGRKSFPNKKPTILKRFFR